MNKDIHTSLGKLKSELEKLEPAIHHLQQADENSQALINASRHIHKEYSTHLAKIEEVLKELNIEHHKQISKDIHGSVQKLNESTDSVGQSYSKFDKLVKEVLENHKKLLNETGRLIQQIDKIDFPVRLDKVDSTVSSINQGLQNVQQRTGDVERNLKDDIQSKVNILINEAEETQRIMVSHFQMLQSQNKLLKIILIVSTALSAGSLLLLILKF